MVFQIDEEVSREIIRLHLYWIDIITSVRDAIFHTSHVVMLKIRANEGISFVATTCGLDS